MEYIFFWDVKKKRALFFMSFDWKANFEKGVDDTQRACADGLAYIQKLIRDGGGSENFATDFRRCPQYAKTVAHLRDIGVKVVIPQMSWCGKESPITEVEYDVEQQELRFGEADDL